MAWSPPTLWTGQSVPITSAEMQKISDDLNFLHDLIVGNSTGGSLDNVDLLGTTTMGNATADGLVQFQSDLGPKVNLWGSTFGIGINTNELALYTGGAVKVRNSAWNAATYADFYANQVHSEEYFRNDVVNTGILNVPAGRGIYFTSGNELFYSDNDQIAGLTRAQTLTNKTAVNLKQQSTSGYVTTANDLTNFMFVYGTGTYTLPTPSSAYTGVFRAVKAWGGGMTVNCAVTQIAGPGATAMAASFAINNGDSVTFWCDGTYWWGL